MEPANILFVIAFIGLPLAFAIWALVSRRELLRNRPRPTEPPVEERPPAPERRRRRRRRRSPQPEQRTRQLPAQEAAEQTRQAPAPQFGQPTVQMPAADQPPPKPPAPPPPPAPEPEPEEQWSGSSGTTEELPIVGYPEWTEPQPQEQQTAAMPATPAPAQPVRQASSRLEPSAHRPFYPPRYRGRAGGIVKRLTPFETQRLVRPKE